MTNEPIEARMARMEEKIDALTNHMGERCGVSVGRIGALEKSTIRQGERLGKLELAEERRKGGMAVMMALWAAAGTLGAVVSRFLPGSWGQ